MNLRMDVFHHFSEPTCCDALLRRILDDLAAIKAQGADLMTAADDMKAKLDQIDAATNNIADDVRRLKEQISTSMSPEDVAAVQARDHGHCRIPNCRERAVHLHHLVYRSKSRGLRWRTENLVSLCVDHHQLVHAGEIQITGNGDGEIEVTGSVDLLKFRL